MSGPIAPPVRFTKMSGGGNDFIVVEAASLGAVPDVPYWVRRVCRRGLSVGADGVLVVEDLGPAEVQLVHYNADGGRSSLCGNGTRCAARWARPRAGGAETIRLATDAGPMEARFTPTGGVTVWLGLRCAAPQVRHVELEDGATVSGHYLEVGIPHFVARVEALGDIPVDRIGGSIRRHVAFGEAGTNVSFVAPRPDGVLEIRTFERGLEAETLACGTACVAAAVVAVEAGWTGPPVVCRPRSGIDLVVGLTETGGGYENLSLEGDARVICEGSIEPEALEWGAPAAGTDRA